MPIEVELPDGSIAEFPDGTAREVMTSAIRKRFPTPAAEASAAGEAPSVPLYVAAGGGDEVNVNANPEVRGQYDQMVAAQDEAKAAEQAQFDASRTPGARVADTAAFMASLPVRAATRGEYGAGDVAGLVSPDAGKAIAESEQDFARANQAGLQVAADVGMATAGIPMLNTLGAVPGQVLRTGIAATRQAPSIAKAFLREQHGAGPIGGNMPILAHTPSGPGGGAPPTPPQAAAGPGRMPNRSEVFEASDRLRANLGTNVDIPEMVAGSNFKQNLAAGLRSVPIAGDPIEAGYTKGLGQLESATKAAGARLGTAAGREAAGEGIKEGVFGWIGKNSKDHLEALYEPVYTAINPAATRPLTAAAQLTRDFAREMAESTGKAEAGALKMLQEAVDRPDGLTVKGISRLRTEVGDKLSESTLNKSPDQRALKRAYGALTNDLRAAVRQHGGDRALAAWDTANREARIVASKSQRLAKAVGINADKLSAEKVFERVLAMGQDKGGDARGLALVQEVVGETRWKNFGAEFLDHVGMDPKTGLFSGDRLLTEYNKLSGTAKTRILGPARQHLDDIATISMKFGQLSGKFNRSNTGIVNGVLKILGNPAGIATNVATAAINPISAFTIGGQLGGLAAGRRLAWTLARPASAQKAANVMRAYYGVAKVAGKGAEAVAKREEGLARAIRAFSLEVARQTGGKASEIEASIVGQLKDLTKKP